MLQVNSIKQVDYIYYMPEIKKYKVNWTMNNQEYTSYIFQTNNEQPKVSSDHYNGNKKLRNCDIAKKEQMESIKQMLIDIFMSNL